MNDKSDSYLSICHGHQPTGSLSAVLRSSWTVRKSWDSACSRRFNRPPGVAAGWPGQPSPAPSARIPWPTVNLARGTSKKSTQPVILSEARQASDKQVTSKWRASDKQVHVVNVEAFILAHISDSADKMACILEVFHLNVWEQSQIKAACSLRNRLVCECWNL